MAERAAGAVRVDPHGHAALFGRGPGALATTAAEVFGAARGSGEAFVLVTDDAAAAALPDLADRDEMVTSGRLRVLSTGAAYPHRDPVRLFAAWSGELDGLLAAGWTGMRVVADNTPLARGSDGAFADWLSWEHTTSRWQAVNPVVGACWFDVDVIGAERAERLAHVHPESFGHERSPSFRLVAATGSVRLLGDVDPHEVSHLVRLLGETPHDGELTVDIEGVGYLHHTVFAALERTPATLDRIRLVGARRALRRVWTVVGDPAGRVELV